VQLLGDVNFRQSAQTQHHYISTAKRCLTLSAVIAVTDLINYIAMGEKKVSTKLNQIRQIHN
jgi:hypothetical protein